MTDEMRFEFEPVNSSCGPLEWNLSSPSPLFKFRSYEAHDYHHKVERRLRLRTFRPVLAKIFEKDSDHSISIENMERPEMRYYKMFTSRMNRKTEHDDPYNSISRKNDALCDAVFEENIVKVKYLMRRGASPNCYDTHRRTPLHIAVSKGNRSLVRMLLSRGADPNLKDGVGNSCLHLAACTHDLDMCLILTERGAKVDVSDIRGRSPIDLARSKLKMFSADPNLLTTSKFAEVKNIVFLLLTKQKAEESTHTALLESCHDRLQIASNPAEISHELDSLGKILDQMESLTIDGK